MRVNKCIDCGILRHRCAKEGRCLPCKLANDKIKNQIRTIEKLTKLGYEILSKFENSSHAKITVKRISCGHTFTAQVNNIFTERTKCCICGPKERMKKCMEGFMRDYARDYNMKKWEDYRNYVRRISNKTYKENIQKLNPNNLPRSKKDNHLDHKIPLIVCFKEGVNPNIAGSLQNLCFVSARDNLSKNKHSYNKKLLEKLRLKSYTYSAM